jgi:hypothetical protein
VLSGWTVNALAVLPPEARLLAEFLACIEDADRQPAVIDANWADLWRRLERPGDPAEPGSLLDALAAAALIQPEASPAKASQPADGAVASPNLYRMHPGVAAAIQAAAPSEVRGATDTDNDPVDPWNAREAILSIGRDSAVALGRWQHSLDLNAEITASQWQRGAGLHEITRTRFNDAAPLIGLRQLGEAGQLLRECQQVFEEHADTTSLTAVLSVRASLEAALGHPDAAAEFGRTALRLGYVRPKPRDIASSHHNLANYLHEAGGDLAGQRAHRLTAALIYRLADMTHDLARTRRDLASELRQEDTAGTGCLPGTVAEVVGVAELTDGVRLGELITALQPDPEAAEAALAQILREAADLPADDGIAEHLERWEPIISDVAAACQGDRDAADRLRSFLNDAAGEQDWAVLAGVLRRILDGEHSQDLLDGLDPIDTAIASQILARLADDGQEPAR